MAAKVARATDVDAEVVIDAPGSTVEVSRPHTFREIEAAVPEYALAKAETLDEILALYANAGIAIESVEDFGAGYKLLRDKYELVGKTLVITEMAVKESDKFTRGQIDDDGNPVLGKYAILRIVTQDPKLGLRHLVITDGSAGICRQVETILAKRALEGLTRIHPLVAHNGLSVSEYDYTDEQGNVTAARTFYLADM